MIFSSKFRAVSLVGLTLFGFIGLAFAHNKVVVVPLLSDPRVIAKYSSNNTSVTLTSTLKTITFVSITSPATGTVIANYTTRVSNITQGGRATCGLSDTNQTSTPFTQSWESGGLNDGYQDALAGTRGFSIQKGQTKTYRVICSNTSTTGTSFTSRAALTAIYVPD